MQRTGARIRAQPGPQRDLGRRGGLFDPWAAEGSTQTHIALLKLIDVVLLLGFEGMHRVLDDGRERLATLSDDVRRLVGRNLPPVPTAPVAPLAGCPRASSPSVYMPLRLVFTAAILLLLLAYCSSGTAYDGCRRRLFTSACTGLQTRWCFPGDAVIRRLYSDPSLIRKACSHSQARTDLRGNSVRRPFLVIRAGRPSPPRLRGPAPSSALPFCSSAARSAPRTGRRAICPDDQIHLGCRRVRSRRRNRP